LQGIEGSTIDVMKKMVAVVSENTKNGKAKRMTDKELASAVLQYHPEPFSQKTLMVLCSTTRYLSYIQVLDILFKLDADIATLTRCCKLNNMI
jgi:hypothetical protein